MWVCSHRGQRPSMDVYDTAGVHWELDDQCIPACNGEPPGSTKAFGCKVREIEHHVVVSSEMFANKFPDKHPREWMKQALIAVEEATEAYMVEVMAAFQCLNQQQISGRYSTCLLRWQGKEIVYSWASPTWALPWTWPKWPNKGLRMPQ